MDTADAQKYLGGNYEFMGVAVRAAEIEQRRDEMKALVKGLQNALVAVQKVTPDDLVRALPPELTTGADIAQMRDILARYRVSLYPTSVAMERPAEDRVAQSLAIAGLLPAGTDTSGLYDTAFAG
jgi:NitT/TauT family transport system substrate-binding protein